MTGTQNVKWCCKDFLLFLRTILRPAAEEFESGLFACDLQLHHVFQVNVLAAHSIDYLAAIRQATGLKENRKELVTKFDQIYAVEGAKNLNRKFQLVDAVNNALKHIQLDDSRQGNKELITQYGPIRFDCLREDKGLILFEVGKYRFDFARVALRPVLDVVTRWEFDETDDVVDFALGKYRDLGDIDEDDPIEQMIDHCNPKCKDCKEGADECRCSEFLYDGKPGEFNDEGDDDFDFDAVMSQISGAYRPD